ncbi:MAG TPA: hypothetical protein VL550_01300 [Rhodocyclaceae bacterium]|jgi:hypothetical protein|nr:hypothetical protein [Rhodocyclaceae bacterium]
MSVSSITDSTSASQNWHSIRKSTSQDFQNLVSSLQQGNLAGAQQAYASLQQVLPTSTSSDTGSNSSQSAASNTIINDWNALGQALQSGSTATAQSALTTLQQDASSVYATLQSANTGTTQGTNPVQNDLNSLSQALQTGHTSSAQQILAQLQQDLQQSGMQPQSGTPGGHHHHHHGGDSNNQQQASNGIASLFASTNPTNTSSLSAQA